MTFFGGKTIADLVFVNHYLGGEGAWDAADIASIDAALAKAMSDSGLQSVIAQYSGVYQLAHAAVGDAARSGSGTIFKDQVEALAARIFSDGGLGNADPGSTASTSCCRAGSSCHGFSPGFHRRRAPRPSTSAA